MKKTISILAAATAIVPLFWWNVIPNAAQGCDAGLPIPVSYSTVRYLPDGSIVPVTGTYTHDARICKMTIDFPKPGNQ